MSFLVSSYDDSPVSFSCNYLLQCPWYQWLVSFTRNKVIPYPCSLFWVRSESLSCSSPLLYKFAQKKPRSRLQSHFLTTLLNKPCCLRRAMIFLFHLQTTPPSVVRSYGLSAHCNPLPLQDLKLCDVWAILSACHEILSPPLKISSCISICLNNGETGY